jgi:hypothetical protein
MGREVREGCGMPGLKFFWGRAPGVRFKGAELAVLLKRSAVWNLEQFSIETADAGRLAWGRRRGIKFQRIIEMEKTSPKIEIPSWYPRISSRLESTR